MKSYINTYASLFRIKLSLAIAVTTLTGDIYFRHSITPASGITFTGVLLLSMAASALNQYQEQWFDGLMERTRNRPIPLHKIASKKAIILFCILFAIGTFILLYDATVLSGVLGIFTLVWYNAVYTPLKQKTPYAFVVGALTGAIPPIIGYVGAGGSIDKKILMISLFMFLWQIPHFLFLLCKYGDQYQKAGFPVLNTSRSSGTIKTVLLVSMIMTLICTLLFPFVGVLKYMPLVGVLYFVNIAILTHFIVKIAMKNLNNDTTRLIYPYQGIILILLILQAFFWG